MHLAITSKNGIEYASLAVSIRNGAKVSKKYENLGRVIDRERNVFYSRKRGLFTYSLETGEYGPAPEDLGCQRRKHRHLSHLLLDFGDTYFLSEFIARQAVTVHGKDGEQDRLLSLRDCLSSIGCSMPDTLFSMVFYYITCRTSNCHAEDWAQGNYISKAFPEADLSSQRISEFLVAIGDEASYRDFFRTYLNYVTGGDVKGTPILIDSTGMPNSIHFPLTAISDHNGSVSNEVRLIYVTHQETGFPIYFRYCAGNIVDVSTLSRTMAELKASGVNTKFAILDAGYFSGDNLRELYDQGISFLLRLRGNSRIYKEVMEKHFNTLQQDENFIRYNDRYAYVKRVEVMLENDNRLYVYLGLDLNRKGEDEQKLFRRSARNSAKKEEVLAAMKSQGVFMLASSRRIAIDRILPTYYTRQDIEQVFDLGKNYSNMLPIRVRSEEAFRGHLLITFIATVILKELQKRLKDTEYNIDTALMNLRNQKCKVYDRSVVTQEPNRKVNDLYKKFGIDCPPEIDTREPEWR